MKLEINDYIRIDGFISKIDYIKKSKNGNEYVQFKQPNRIIAHINSKLIEKASHNIIDLIEIGDYVNGKEVTCVTGNNYIELDYGCNMVGCHNEDIKTILTHEQFENNCYKIGDE